MPNPQLNPICVDPMRPFTPPGAGAGAVCDGGHTPEMCAASSDMPQHHPACMRARFDAPVTLLPPRAPVPANPVAFDHGI